MARFKDPTPSLQKALLGLLNALPEGARLGGVTVDTDEAIPTIAASVTVVDDGLPLSFVDTDNPAIQRGSTTVEASTLEARVRIDLSAERTVEGGRLVRIDVEADAPVRTWDMRGDAPAFWEAEKWGSWDKVFRIERGTFWVREEQAQAALRALATVDAEGTIIGEPLGFDEALEAAKALREAALAAK